MIFRLMPLVPLLWVAPVAAQDTPRSATLFRHVNVVPMDRERVIRNRDVLVEEGVIKGVGKDLRAPANATVIDGKGRFYLSPGLSDLHVHSDTRNDLAIYLANGVTTILNMGEARNGFVAQTRVNANLGLLPSPHVYVAFLVDGSPRYGHFIVSTPAEARALVHLAKTNGYSFIKVYNNLSAECFEALLDEGKVLGVPVVGHGVTAVGLGRQLAEGQLLAAHAEEFLYTVFFPDGADVGTRAPRLDQIADVVDATRRSGAFVTADLFTYETIAAQWGRPGASAALLAGPGAQFLAQEDRLAWAREDYAGNAGSLADRTAFLTRFVKALSDAGVPIVTGTDAPAIPGLAPGASLHQELEALQEAGLSRFAALSAATRTPGEFFAKALPAEQRFGTVTVGMRADLILSTTNPLDDLSVLQHPVGIMAAGRWYSSEALAELKHSVQAGYASAIVAK